MLAWGKGLGYTVQPRVRVRAMDFNINTVLKRLEAATSRLEDIVVYNEGKSSESLSENRGTVSPRTSSVAASAAPPMPRSSNPSPRASVPSTGAAATAAVATQAPAANKGLDALKAIEGQQLAEYVKISTEIAPAVGKQAEQFKLAYAAMLKFVSEAQSQPKPASIDDLVTLLNPINTEAGKIEDIRSEFRSERELTNFLATVPAGSGALGWVSIEGKNEAANFIQEMRDSSLFYGNRALKDHSNARAWLNSFTGVLDGLKQVVKTEFPAGIEWNVTPGAASSASASSAPAPPAPAPGAGAPPPPPPPPSVADLTKDLGSSSSAPAAAPAGGLTGVFAELNQGENIASALKPVDKKALKSTKPPVPKSSKPGKPSSSSSATSAPTARTGGAKKTPRVELAESTWYVEDLDEKHDIEIEASMGQSVRIDNCNNCTITIKGKAATFNLSRCNRVGLLVQTMVASCDIVNCQNFGLQVTGTVPSLMIDQSGQGSIYLSEDSLGVDIFTSQTTAINVNLPEGEPGAYREVPLGEQIVHNIVGENIKSQVVKHA